MTDESELYLKIIDGRGEEAQEDRKASLKRQALQDLVKQQHLLGVQNYEAVENMDGDFFVTASRPWNSTNTAPRISQSRITKQEVERRMQWLEAHDANGGE
jgi:hypothetical protein